MSTDAREKYKRALELERQPHGKATFPDARPARDDGGLASEKTWRQELIGQFVAAMFGNNETYGDADTHPNDAIVSGAMEMADLVIAESRKP